MAELAGVGRYERLGRGRPVVVLSSPMADPGWWAGGLVAALTAADHEVVTFVHAGPGVAPGDVARDVGALIEHLGCGPVHLLGWSQGAAIAQEVALLRPDLVASAALVAGYGRQNTIDRILQDAWQCLDDAGPDLDPVRLALLALTSHPPHALGEDAYLDPLVDGMRHWSAETDGPSDSCRRARAFIDSYRDRLPALASIRVPCLVMGFESDADTFVVRAREVAAAIPASRYVELPGAGHLTPVTAPEQVAGPVVRFFDEVEAGPPGAAGNAKSPRHGASP